MCLCVAVNCLSQKFGIWSLPGLSSLVLPLVPLRHLFHIVGSIPCLGFVGTVLLSSMQLHYIEIISHKFPSTRSPLALCLVHFLQWGMSA
jgi:hypothetical protein